MVAHSVVFMLVFPVPNIIGASSTFVILRGYHQVIMNRKYPSFPDFLRVLHTNLPDMRSSAASKSNVLISSPLASRRRLSRGSPPCALQGISRPQRPKSPGTMYFGMPTRLIAIFDAIRGDETRLVVVALRDTACDVVVAMLFVASNPCQPA